MGYPYFPEDDEMEPQEELAAIDKEMAYMAERRSVVAREARKKKMDPKDEKLVEVAWRAGQGEAETKALRDRIKHLERRIEVRDRELERTADRDDWKDRAEKAEATLTRSRAARRKR